MAKAGRPTREEAAKRERLKKLSINKAAKPQKISMDTEETFFRCSCCGKKYDKQVGNFSSTLSILYKGNNGYTDICRTCIDKYYTQLVDYFNGNETKAIERICQIFDWYYCDEAVAATEKISSGTTRIRLYPGRAMMAQIKRKGETYLDTIAQQTNGNTIEKVEDITDEELEKAEVKSLTKDEIAELASFFGFGYKPEEYEFLRNQYEDWASRCEIKSKVQEEIFKNICVTQLMAQDAKRRGNIKDYNDAMKTFQDLLTSANVKPSQKNGNALVDANTLGTLIQKWENEKPIPEPDEQFKDVDNIKKYIDTFFLGHLAKMMNIENDCSKQYDEEMKKYTVTRQEYEDDEVIGDAISEEQG